MRYQLGWTTLPGMRGLSVSGFRAEPAGSEESSAGVTLDFASSADCEALMRQMEAEFASRRFNNAADAFDVVKAYALEHAPRSA